MSANPMQRKVRNSFLLGILVSLLIAILVVTVLFFVLIKPKLDKEREIEEQLYVYAYRLKPGINVKSGEEITSGMVESVEIPVETTITDFIPSKMQLPDGTLTDMVFTDGYKSKIELTEGTILTYNMLFEEEQTPNSLRYIEYNMITMPTMLNIGDYVDVRLRLPNGQDLVVTSKKEVMNLYGQTVGFNLKEEEILILNSAIVEAYIMMGSAELYLATYVEPGIQEAAIYTYMPTNEVITLINMDENIVSTARNSLAALYSKQGVADVRGQINSSTGQFYEDSKENIQEGIKAQIEAAKKAREDYLSELEGY